MRSRECDSQVEAEEALKPVYIKHCVREQHPTWPDGQLFEM